MTCNLDVLYRYKAPPADAVLTAVAKARSVYGIRRIVLDEDNNTVQVEFDATRLRPENIANLLRRAGLELAEELSPAPAK